MLRYPVLIMLMMVMCLQVYAQVTPNIGFDNGTFSGWQCWVGKAGQESSFQMTQPVFKRHTLLDKYTGYYDPYGQFPAKCPNGSAYSIMLGNDQTGAEAERVSYTFTVPSKGDYTVIFDYAVVLQNPSDHSPEQQPRFKARVFNVTDNVYLDCPSFDFIAGPDLPGFKLAPVQPNQNSMIYFKDWGKATIDLHDMPNKVMRIEFTTYDCTQGAHFGYAYLDVEDADTTPPITGNTYCNNTPSLNLLGPTGFAQYTWYNADKTTVLGSDHSLNITPPPPNNTKYILHIEPYPGLGCPDDLTTVVNKIDADMMLMVKDTIKTCPGQPLDLTGPDVTAGSKDIAILSYFNDAAANDEIDNPVNITKTGTYYIRGISKDGCTSILPIYFGHYDATPLHVTDPAEVTFPASVDLSLTFEHIPGITYNYLTDKNANYQLVDYKNVKRSGIYYIKAVSAAGCETIAPVKVTVHPPPPIEVTAPNTFTPNGDGVNDHFVFTASGNYTFIDLKIYNRNGQLLYTTRSMDDHWDGRLRGSNVPAGVYFWVFECTDDYTNSKVTRGGSVAVIR